MRGRYHNTSDTLAMRKTTTPHWDGQSLVLETSGNLTKGRYLRGGGLVAQVIDLSLFFYLLNAHGDVVQRVGPNGAPLS